MSGLKLLALFPVLLSLTACGGRVRVVDPSGNPIEGAEVAPYSWSINDSPKQTNSRGETTVPLDIDMQQTIGIFVSKPGFERQDLSLPTKWPLKVILQPANSPAH